MAAAVYSPDNTQHRFLYAKVMQMLLNEVSSRSLQASRLARMNIFPYAASDGSIHLTSLTADHLPWFYLKDGQAPQTSRGSYRILADGVLPSGLKEQLIAVLGDFLQEYDRRTVIRKIISQMKQEYDYSAAWWARAAEIYELWNGSESLGDESKAASGNIDNDYFLFLPTYCDPKYAKLLLRLGVFRDIHQHPGSGPFFAAARAHAGKNPDHLLQLLGVPASFVRSDNTCSPYLRRLFLGIRDYVYFPLSGISELEEELCQLSHYVVFSLVQAENAVAFRSLVQNVLYREGIVVRNRRSSYIPLSCSLFYQPAPLNGQARIAMTDDPLEAVHLDESAYETSSSQANAQFWQTLRVHPLDGSIQYMPQYRFGNLRVSEGQFYRWIWHYLPDLTTARLILGWQTMRGHAMTADADRPLVMDALRLIRSAPPQNTDRSFRFRLGTTVADAVRDAAVINALAMSETLKNIHIIISDPVSKYARASSLKDRLVQVVPAKPAVKSALRLDRIWNNIYTTPALSEGKYLVAWCESISNADLADEQILLVPEEAAEKGVLQFVGKKYHLDTSQIDLSGRNCQRDFRQQIYDIRSFISAPHQYTSTPVEDHAVIPLGDVASAGKELELWLMLKTTRDLIWNSDKPLPNTDYGAFNLESFLRRIYRGHCQICGRIIPEHIPEDQYSFMLADRPGTTFAYAVHNLLCLCPTCHSDLRMGYGRRDLSAVARKANEYIARMEKQDGTPGSVSIVRQMASMRRFSEGFQDPIVIDICANDKEERLFFSWEHFIRLSLVFYNPEHDYQYQGEIGNLMQLLRMLAISQEG
ncbi:MAG: hypothetical protein ACI4O7_09165 [Aristaeellaceae bacterium]